MHQKVFFSKDSLPTSLVLDAPPSASSLPHTRKYTNPLLPGFPRDKMVQRQMSCLQAPSQKGRCPLHTTLLRPSLPDTASVPEQALPQSGASTMSREALSTAEPITKALHPTSEERDGATQLMIPLPLDKLSGGLACKCVAGERSKQKCVAGQWEKGKGDPCGSYRERNGQRREEYTDSESGSPNSLSFTVKLEQEQTRDPPTGMSDFPRDCPADANKYPCISVLITC